MKLLFLAAICINHDLHFACLFSCAVAFIMLLLAGWHSFCACTSPADLAGGWPQEAP